MISLYCNGKIINSIRAAGGDDRNICYSYIVSNFILY